MKRILLFFFFTCLYFALYPQEKLWNVQQAYTLSLLPLKCIQQEYPNKTAHIIMDSSDAQLTPSQLHPSFYGCFDWHSSVHGHWMLVKILKEFPQIPNRDSIIAILDESFNATKIKEEAKYFTKYPLASTFERTYGWAWLLKLDEELSSWNHKLGKKWQSNLQPLTSEIIRIWKVYLPKQTYPNNTGVHPNSAFGLSFALDWAIAKGDIEFEAAIKEKAKTFYFHYSNYPAYLEPDGSDFFSNSLFIADLMSKVLNKNDYEKWLEQFLRKEDFIHLGNLPHVSDRSDYLIVHLDGLILSRGWNLKNIAKALGETHPNYVVFMEYANAFITAGLESLDKGNYGGEHWLASFAVYALTR